MPPKKSQKKTSEAELLKQLESMDKEPETVIEPTTSAKETEKNIEIEVTPPEKDLILSKPEEEVKRVGRRKTKTQVEPILLTADSAKTVRSRSTKVEASSEVAAAVVSDKEALKTPKKDILVVKSVKKTPNKATKPPKGTEEECQVDEDVNLDLKSSKRTPRKSTKPSKGTEVESEEGLDLKSTKKTPKKSDDEPKSAKKIPTKSSAKSDDTDVEKTLKKIAKTSSTSDIQKHDPISTITEPAKNEPKPRGRPSRKQNIVVETDETPQATVKTPLSEKNNAKDGAKNEVKNAPKKGASKASKTVEENKENKDVAKNEIKPKKGASKSSKPVEDDKENTQNESKKQVGQRSSRLASKVSVEYCKS